MGFFTNLLRQNVSDGLNTAQKVIVESSVQKSSNYIAHVMQNADTKGVSLLRAAIDDRMSNDEFQDVVKASTAHIPPAHQEVSDGLKTHMGNLRSLGQGEKPVIAQLLSFAADTIVPENTQRAVMNITKDTVNAKIQAIEIGIGR